MEEEAAGGASWVERYLNVKLQMEASWCARLTAAAFAEAFTDGSHGVTLSLNIFKKRVEASIPVSEML